MEPELLRDLRERGRFFCEIFPGAKASEEWQRHRARLEHEQAENPQSPSSASVLLPATQR